eukprot:gene30163-35143_t
MSEADELKGQEAEKLTVEDGDGELKADELSSPGVDVGEEAFSPAPEAEAEVEEVSEGALEADGSQGIEVQLEAPAGGEVKAEVSTKEEVVEEGAAVGSSEVEKAHGDEFKADASIGDDMKVENSVGGDPDVVQADLAAELGVQASNGEGALKVEEGTGAGLKPEELAGQDSKADASTGAQLQAEEAAGAESEVQEVCGEGLKADDSWETKLEQLTLAPVVPGPAPAAAVAAAGAPSKTSDSSPSPPATAASAPGGAGSEKKGAKSAAAEVDDALPKLCDLDTFSLTSQMTPLTERSGSSSFLNGEGGLGKDPQAKPKLLMRRQEGTEDGDSNSTQSTTADKKAPTIEERVEDYQRARERILGIPSKDPSSGKPATSQPGRGSGPGGRGDFWCRGVFSGAARGPSRGGARRIDGGALGYDPNYPAASAGMSAGIYNVPTYGSEAMGQGNAKSSGHAHARGPPPPPGGARPPGQIGGGVSGPPQGFGGPQNRNPGYTMQAAPHYRGGMMQGGPMGGAHMVAPQGVYSPSVGLDVAPPSTGRGMGGASSNSYYPGGTLGVGASAAYVNGNSVPAGMGTLPSGAVQYPMYAAYQQQVMGMPQMYAQPGMGGQGMVAMPGYHHLQANNMGMQPLGTGQEAVGQGAARGGGRGRGAAPAANSAPKHRNHVG